MGALPKRKISYGRKRRKRFGKKAKAPATVKCSNCGAAKQPHRVCPECGKK